MTPLEHVAEFIKDANCVAYCDDCITEKLGLSADQHVGRHTSALARLPNCDRHEGKCSRCEGHKQVIRYVRTRSGLFD